MSLGLASEHLAILRDDAHAIVDAQGRQEDQLEAFVAATGEDLRQAEAAVSEAAAALDVDEFRCLLGAQLRRSAAGATAARQLLAAAHQLRAVGDRLLAHLAAVHGPDAPCPNAVLVVDDHDGIREMLARVLQSAGFVVRTAANGLEGLIAAYEMRPAVIVMDVSMPVLDGVEATRLIKSVDAMRDARVIAHTGNPSFDATAAHALFAAVLPKPATPGAVLALVRHFAAP